MGTIKLPIATILGALNEVKKKFLAMLSKNSMAAAHLSLDLLKPMPPQDFLENQGNLRETDFDQIQG